MNRKYKFIVFDLIDTLVSGDSISQSTINLEREIGEDLLNIVIDSGRIDIERSVDDIILRIKKSHILSDRQEKMIRDWIELDNFVLFPDVQGIFKYLRSRSYVIGIISNSPPMERNLLETLQINEYIDSCLFSFECGYKKPDTRIYRFFLNKYNMKASDVLMIGNSIEDDVLGPRNVGINTILLDRNNSIDFHNKIRDLSELEQIL